MRGFILGGVMLITMMFPGLLYAQEMEKIGRLHIGTDLGFQVETRDGTAFALALNGDYYLDRNFSVGPLIQLAFSGDLTQFGLSLQGKYTFDLAGNPGLKPHFQGGLGFINSDLDGPGNGSDTSFLVPLGAGFEYKLAENISASSTLLLNFTGLTLGTKDASNSLAWYFGLRFVL